MNARRENNVVWTRWSNDDQGRIENLEGKRMKLEDKYSKRDVTSNKWLSRIVCNK